MDISEGRPYPLGSTCDARGVNFSIISSVATRVELCLFDRNGDEQCRDLPGRSGDCWHGHVPGIGDGQLYGYRVHGPWDPAAGHLCGPERLLLDPYGRGISGTVRWDDALFPYDASAPAAPAHTRDTAAFVPRSIVVDGAFDWAGDHPPRTPLAESVIYEMHVRGFTQRHPDVPSELRGTYAGLAHPAAIGHLTRLGITAIELLPIQAFIHRRHLEARGQRNYWGYDPIGYFAPHGEYAADPVHAAAEFKAMVRELHRAGIEVILDVVFNHTGEGGVDGPILAFRGIDNAAYYRLDSGDDLRYVDVTGTQNTFNARHPQARRLIIDSLRYWVGEMHVDGFRFDLTPALLREDNAVNMRSALLDRLRADPVLAGVKLIAEPWDLGADGYRLGQFPAEWSEWNDRYRDEVRDYWNGRNGGTLGLVRRLGGSRDVFGASARPPQASVNFVTCHDGFTLADLVSYEQKHNAANGEDNRDGPDDNHSWNCGVEGETDDGAILALRKRQQHNFLATLLLSQGVPMLLAGDELGRSQEGNNNAYCQDNELSWLDWTPPLSPLLDLTAALIRVRREHAALRATAWPDIQWFDTGGHAVSEEMPGDAPPMPLQAYVAADGAELGLFFNPTDEVVEFSLPDGRADASWREVLNTSRERATARQAHDAPGREVAGHSMVVMRAGA